MNPTDDSTLQPAMHPALELLQSGGPVVAILLVLSVAALAIVLAKLWQFRRLGDARTAEALVRRRSSSRRGGSVWYVTGPARPTRR